jgi:hypothetical protein
MSINAKKFLLDININSKRNEVQWYEFVPMEISSFVEFHSKEIASLNRVDIFNRTELVQSTDFLHVPEFDLPRHNLSVLSGVPPRVKKANQTSSLKKFYVFAGDVIFVRIECSRRNPFKFNLSRIHVLDISQSNKFVIEVKGETKLILDQGSESCNFKIDFGDIKNTDVSIVEDFNVLIKVEAEARSQLSWTYRPKKDHRYRSLLMSTIIPYITLLNIEKQNG